ncbi:MAG: NrdH-redoxin [Leptolinea sp.]|nr:NrdH-redoxin [Leptolinea sp.]
MTETIVVYGTAWCGGSRRAKRILETNSISYKWIDIDSDRDARDLVEKINNGFRSVPTILFPDGSKLVEPSDEELAKKLGVPPPASFF